MRQDRTVLLTAWGLMHLTP